MTTPNRASSNDARKWDIELIDPADAVNKAMRMGPGPYLAVPLAYFIAAGERTQYALALWIPEVSGVEDGSLTQSELADLLARWEADGLKLSVRPLYVGPQGFEYTGEYQRPYQQRVAQAMEASIWMAVQHVQTRLMSSDTPAGRSWRATAHYSGVRAVGFWRGEN